MSFDEALTRMKDGNIISTEMQANGVRDFLRIGKNGEFIGLFGRNGIVSKAHISSKIKERTDFIIDNSEKELFDKLLG